jgi:hypothetical protein
MLRKMMIALMATVALGVVAPEAASARGGFGGGHAGFGGFHGGGGGWHGGGIGFHHGGIGGPHFVGGFHPGFHRRVFIAGAGYGYYDDYPYDAYPDQVYDDGGYVEESSCSLVRQRVHTRHGWRTRAVQVCHP